LSTTQAKIDVHKLKITLRVWEDKIVFTTNKPTSNIIKRVYALGLLERMMLDLEYRLMGKTLVLNRSQDPNVEDLVELIDLNEPIELRQNQVEDLGPTIDEGEVIDEPIINELTGNDEYDSEASYDDLELDDDIKYAHKIKIDSALNLQFSCMIGFKYIHANFSKLFDKNVMSKKFYNSIMKDELTYEGKNIIKNFMNVPVFAGKFYVLTYFEVVENMNIYSDKGMGKVISGKPFTLNVNIIA
ncbi:hypothetical protein Tco_1557180, partial [Tanacetum coccineum]